MYIIIHACVCINCINLIIASLVAYNYYNINVAYEAYDIN